jgi:hypothetical protein
MQIAPAHRIIYFLTLICGIWLFWLFITEGGNGTAPWVIIPFLMLTVTWVFSPQINWWWYLRHPPKIDPRLMTIVENSPFYQGLSATEKVRFGQRVFMITLGKNFMRPAPPGSDKRMDEQVPPDLKAIFGSAVAQLTFGLEEFMLGKFENIIIYPHLFVTPQYPHQAHPSELFEEDGVLLFSADELVQGVTQPYNFFNIGLYETARAFQILHPEKMPNLPPSVWDELKRVGWGATEAAISLNLLEPDIFGVAAVNFWTFPEKMRQEMPELYQIFQNIFRQNPLQITNPCIA